MQAKTAVPSQDRLGTLPPHGSEAIGTAIAPRVFLAHTDHQLRSRLAVALCRFGCRVERFPDTKSLLERLADEMLTGGFLNESQALVAEVKSRDRNGCRLLSDLRRAGYTIPVVLLCKRFDWHLTDLTRRLGLACVFRSPFETEDLVTALFYLLEKEEALRLRRIGNQARAFGG